MWHFIGITIVFLVSTSISIEASQDIYSRNNERQQQMINWLEAVKMALAPRDTTWKELKDSLKHLQRRSIIKLGVEDGPSVHRLGSKSPAFVRWSFWPDIESDKERRNPSFSPWGGKRDSSAYKPDPKIRRPARVPFNSWGGKRDGEHTDVIKKPFNSWGGKRSLVIGDILRAPASDILRNSWHHSIINSPKSVALQPHDFLMSDFPPMEKKEFFNAGGMAVNRNVPRVAFEPWGGRKRDSDASSEIDITVTPSPYIDCE
ncbi:uncharacterized protein LOC135161413 isoform X2 [Diachasmimorpha longicaudata]|uniref:uncharacterized protein LOC135161413 isoform X2 n=1 Tax=Diachasmimorpha longicaudata TaxID=58733 RepID=UPI0030B8BE1D